MKKTGLLVTICILVFSSIKVMACTGLLVGKKASVDGSVMIRLQIHTRYTVSYIVGRLLNGLKVQCWIFMNGIPINI